MKIIVTTTTFPSHNKDIVPRFVHDQLLSLKKLDEKLEIFVLTPHHAYSTPVPSVVKKSTHTEVRFHYFIPHKFEKLCGRGILPSIRRNPLLLGMIPFFFWAQKRALSRLCKLVEPDLIYAHWFMPQAIIAAGVSRRYKIPYMFTSHASDVSVLQKLPFSSYLIAHCLNTASYFTAVSERTARKITSIFPNQKWDNLYADKFSIIPMGTKLINTTQKRSQTPETPINIPCKEYILFLGRLSEKKGVEFLLDGFKTFRASATTDLQLVIAGDGELAKKLSQATAKLELDKQVHFVGHVNDKLKEEILHNADVVVIPSIVDSNGDSEGMPVVLMEALASRKRVIATTESGAEEILTKSSGILIPPKSSASIANALHKLNAQSKLERHSMENAAGELSKQFDWENISRKYYRIIQEITE